MPTQKSKRSFTPKAAQTPRSEAPPTSDEPSGVVDRVKLLDALKVAAPALVKQAISPVFGCFLFTGKEVVAYNNIFAIGCSASTGAMQGCLQGKLIQELLSATTVESISKVSVEKETIRFRLGGANVDLPVIQSEEFPLDLPTEDGPTLAVPEDIIDVLSKISKVMCREVVRPKLCGVTLSVAEDGNQEWLAADGPMGIRVRIPAPKVGSNQFRGVIGIPPESIDAIVGLGENLKGARWEATAESHLKIRTDTVWMISRLNAEVDANMYHQIFNQYSGTELVGVPSGLQDVLRRAVIVLDSGGFNQCTVTCERGQMLIDAEVRGVAAIRDTVPWEGAESRKFTVDPRRWISALDGGVRMGLGSGAIVLSYGKPRSLRYLIGIGAAEL